MRAHTRDRKGLTSSTIAAAVSFALLLCLQTEGLRASQRPHVVMMEGGAGFTVHGTLPSELGSKINREARRVFRGHKGFVRGVAFSPDGRLALSAGADNTLRLWDLESGRSLRTFQGDTKYMFSAAFSPDGRLVLSESGKLGHEPRLWDVASGRSLRTFRGHRMSVFSIAFSPNGKRALSGSGDGTLRLWDVASGTELHVFRGHRESVYSVVFSPDGKRALSGGKDGTVRLWDVASGSEIRVFQGHDKWVGSVAFSPDGRRALSGGADFKLRIWDVASGKEIRAIKGHRGAISSVAFSPDGSQALSGSEDKTLRLWDVASGKGLRIFQGHEKRVYSVAFSPDGRQALSGSFDSTLRLWDIVTEPPPGHLSLKQMRRDVQKEVAEALRRFQDENVGPPIPDPNLPAKQELRQDPFESRDKFEERVARAEAEWNQEAFEIQEQYRRDVRARNAKVKHFDKDLSDHKWDIYSSTLADVQGHPVLTAREDESGQPKYDSEQGRLHLAFRFEHASEAEDWVFSVPANKPIRTLYEALKNGVVSASAEYRIQGDSVTLHQVVAHHGNTTYRGKPASGEFEAPERRTVRIGGFDDGIPEPEQQPEVDLGWKIPKPERNPYSGDDIRELLSKTRAAQVDHRKWLFVIGIGDYSDTNDINYSRRTAEMFARVAQKTLGILKTRTRLLLDTEATSGRIKSKLTEMLRDTREGDVIYFYYSGHGIPVPEQNNAPFILPQDVTPYFGGEYPYYRVDNIYKELEDSKASRVIAFMDSCFTGITDGESVFEDDTGATILVPKIFEPSSTGKLAVLTAGTKKQYSNSYKDKGHRLFSYFVMRALIEGHTGNIGNLHKKVYTDVHHQTVRIMGGGGYTQEPEIQGNSKLKLR